MSGYGAPPGSYGTLPNYTTPPAILERRRKDRKIVLWSLLAIAVIFTLMLWRCGTTFYRTAQASDAAAAEFHEKLNNEQYHEIYTEADHLFQESGKEEDYTKFFRGIHDKLGKAGNAKLQNINLNTNMQGSFATIIYDTAYERGSAVETFTWRRDGGRLLLVGYNIQSPELVKK